MKDTGLIPAVSSVVVPLSGYGDEVERYAEIDMDSMDLQQLEELSFDLAVRSGKIESAMWTVLAHVWETSKWRATHREWEDYLQEWLYEACNRSGGQRPYSLREAQQRLSNYRRLGRWAGVDPNVALSGSSDVMATLSRAIGDWDNAGNLLRMRQEAADGLDAMYPGEPVKDQIRKFAEQVATEPVHKKAIDLIGDVLNVHAKGTVYLFDVIATLDTGTVIQCRKQDWHDDGYLLSEERFRTGEQWPEDAVAALRGALRSRTTKQ